MHSMLKWQQNSGRPIRRYMNCLSPVVHCWCCNCRHFTTIGICHGQAFNNILKRMLEAKGRGMWNADAETLERLQKLYAQSDAALEGV